MHDGAHQYEPDTVVVDLDDEPIIAMPRVPTEELTMQVFLMGQWHRKIADLNETACEVPFRLSDERTRREQLSHRDGVLCTICFTPRELRRANENDQRLDEEEERRRQRDDIDSRFKALPRIRRPTNEGDR